MAGAVSAASASRAVTASGTIVIAAPATPRSNSRRRMVVRGVDRLCMGVLLPVCVNALATETRRDYGATEQPVAVTSMARPRLRAIGSWVDGGRTFGQCADYVSNASASRAEDRDWVLLAGVKLSSLPLVCIDARFESESEPQWMPQTSHQPSQAGMR